MQLKILIMYTHRFENLFARQQLIEINCLKKKKKYARFSVKYYIIYVLQRIKPKTVYFGILINESNRIENGINLIRFRFDLTAKRKKIAHLHVDIIILLYHDN